MFYGKSMIERSQVFQLNFENLTVATGTRKLLPSVDSN